MNERTYGSSPSIRGVIPVRGLARMVHDTSWNKRMPERCERGEKKNKNSLVVGTAMTRKPAQPNTEALWSPLNKQCQNERRFEDRTATSTANGVRQRKPPKKTKCDDKIQNGNFPSGLFFFRFICVTPIPIFGRGVCACVLEGEWLWRVEI